MAIASGLFWIVVGVAYIIYQGFKADWATTVVVLLVGVAIPVAGVTIYFVDKLLQLIHPLFAGAFWCSAIIVGYILYLRWCHREKRKRDADLMESRRKREAELHKYENRCFSEDDIIKMISKFKDNGGQDKLEIRLHRAPTDEEIREAAVENAVAEFLLSYKILEKALHAASTSDRFF